MILCTRFEFGNRAELWKETSESNFIPAPRLGRTGVSKERFKDFCPFVGYSSPPDNVPDLSAKKCWGLVDEFYDTFNKHKGGNC